MLLWFLYAAVRGLLELSVRAMGGEADEDLEIVVLRHELAMLRRQAKRVGAGTGSALMPPALPHTRESIRRGRRAYALAQAIREAASEGAEELEAACRVPDGADDR
jgi:hypothetical protein